MNKRFIDLKKTLGKFIANFSTIEEDGKTFIFDGDEVRSEEHTSELQSQR